MKNILLTGCSRGVGLSIAKSLVVSGYNVYGVSRKITKEYQQLMDTNPEHVFYAPFDLSNPDGVQNVIFKEYIPNSIPLHGFINNAAIAYDDIITNLDLDRLRNMFEVNVFSPLNITKYAIRNMIYNRVKGSIVHISSISVHTGYKGLAMYAGSKGALEAFSKNTAREWGERGIRSNCLVAGFMDTDMSSTLGDDMKDRIFKRTSLKVPTALESVADMIKFLISEEAKSVTGQNIHVDSGTI
ncbi:SDR family NAD(P)-dependent oxidoreductase [Nonlabens agnitus]|uniref:3-oxoacyl-ACP reductase n=1 Tax=Nonlabens agnitus TaxID=870484 RepID=A0A2S9WUA0_9FLAO|nr:SDR family oxidoreductase [Nonlabens agnitus]PRP66916.1 3-oxoacyl-ACP reductase [Nonlabens agnitus]